MKEKTSKQTELNFIDLTEVDNRTKVREVSLARAERLHTIDISIIRIRPGLHRPTFNWRLQQDLTEELYEIRLGIPQLAEGIFISNGSDDPLSGDIKDGLFYINEGERRFRALRYLINSGREIYPNGNFVGQVEVLLNPKGFTDKDRKRRIYTSGNKLKYTPLEQAYGYLEMVQDDGMTHEEIAQLLNISRQTVDNYILITEMPTDLQQKIENDEVKLTNALAEYRQSKKKKRLVEVDEETGEVFKSLSQEEREKEEAARIDKISGDENEFDQQDNSITGPGSAGGPKQEGSGAVVIGKDAIYLDQQKLALRKQFVHRYEKLKIDIMDGNRSMLAWEDELATQLKNEYNLTVK